MDPTKSGNKEWGFYGTIQRLLDLTDQEADEVFHDTVIAIMNKIKRKGSGQFKHINPYAIRLYLDGPGGRYLADTLDDARINPRRPEEIADIVADSVYFYQIKEYQDEAEELSANVGLLNRYLKGSSDAREELLKEFPETNDNIIGYIVRNRIRKADIAETIKEALTGLTEEQMLSMAPTEIIPETLLANLVNEELKRRLPTDEEDNDLLSALENLAK